MRALILRLAAVGLGSSLMLLGVSPAMARPTTLASPKITSFKVTPSPARPQGGNVTAAATVKSAQTCTFSSTPKLTGLPVTRQCASGKAAVTVKLPPNGSIAAKRFTIKLTVHGSGHVVTASKTLTQPPLTLTGVKTVVGQGEDYCALLTTGRVDCWGFNAYGQLGDGKFKNSSRPVPVVSTTGNGALTGVTSVISGPLGYGFQYCAVLRSGGVDCWGYNLDGQLGNGTTKTSDKPVPVKGVGGTGLLTGVKQVQPEIYGYCAALTAGGAVCWGLNENGQLGDNTATGPDSCGGGGAPCSTTPVTVLGTSGTGALSQVASLTGEDETMCALLTTSGVDCWGYGPAGQVGNGGMSGSLFPAVVEGIGGTGTLTGVTSLTGQDAGTTICARLTSGQVACWGDDTWGELGNGLPASSGNNSSFPVLVKKIGGSTTKVKSVTDAPGQTNCAILATSGADCWGYNGNNILGNPTVPGLTSSVPVNLTNPGGKGTLAGITALVTGDGDEGANICALLTGGRVDCWGFASAGFSQTPSPVTAFGPGKAQVRVSSLASDQDGSTCAVLVTGGVDCWGVDVVGQLGNGTITGSLTPEPVLAPA